LNNVLNRLNRLKISIGETKLIPYLVEGRLHGFAKRYAKSLILEIANKFNVKEVLRYRPVPHITLAGAFTTSNIREVIREIKSIGKKYSSVKFKIKGFDCFDDTEGRKVIYIAVYPSEELKGLRRELAERLSQWAKLKEFDMEKDFIFHITIAFRDIDKKFNKIWKYLQEKEIVEINSSIFRLTLLRHRKIMYEYDLLFKKLLDRREALNKNRLKYEFGLLHEESPKIYLDNRDIDRVYLIGDTHFDHKNIIKYCNRPFKNVKEMNKKLLKNWNKTIGKDDLVFFLGDLAFGKRKHKVGYWLNKLNGRIYLIQGNHDKKIPSGIPYLKRCIIKYGDDEFRLIHRPDEAGGWKGWIIHGHHHNNHPQYYPFINSLNKTINVSVEMIDYKPISFASLLSLISEDDVSESGNN